MKFNRIDKNRFKFIHHTDSTSVENCFICEKRCDHTSPPRDQRFADLWFHILLEYTSFTYDCYHTNIDLDDFYKRYIIICKECDPFLNNIDDIDKRDELIDFGISCKGEESCICRLGDDAFEVSDLCNGCLIKIKHSMYDGLFDQCDTCRKKQNELDNRLHNNIYICTQCFDGYLV